MNLYSFVLAFLLGICTLYCFREIPSIVPLIGLFCLLGSIIVLLKKKLNKLSIKSEEKKYDPITFKKVDKKFYYCILIFKKVLAFCLVGVLGFLYISLYSNYLLARSLPTSLEKKPIEIIARIDSLPEKKITFFKGKELETYRFEAQILQTIPNTLWPKPGKIRLSWHEPDEKISPGSIWQFTVKLKRAINYANPGSFDYEKHLFSNHWVAEGYISDKTVAKKLSQPFYFRFWHQIREYLHLEMQKLLPESPFSALIIALIIGCRSTILPIHWEVFQATGTAHLMAISGLHVGIIAAIVFKTSQFCWKMLPVKFLKIPSQQFAAFNTLIISLFYALIAGLSVPTQRAFIMVAVFMVGLLRRRSFSSWRSFFLALFLILLLDPLSTLTAGFWLSFLAVGIMIYGMQNRFSPQGLWYQWGRAQWVVFLGLLPISLTIFGQVSLVAPLANIIAIPWVSFFVVPLALLGCLLIPISKLLAGFLLKISENFLALLWPGLKYLQTLEYALWCKEDAHPFILILSFVGCLWLLSPKGFPGKRYGLIFILPLVFSAKEKIAENTALVTVLDVGQGLAVVVETTNHVLVYDTGPKLSPEFDTGDRVVLPYLKKRGIKSIDKIVISHTDNDHIGGLTSILKKIVVNEISSSEPEVISHDNVNHCMAGQNFVWDGVHFEFLHPFSRMQKKRNDYSCVLRVSAGSQSILLTGDIEKTSEVQILNRYQYDRKKLQSNIMLVPHHGSKTSSSLGFIMAINPEYAVIPVGYHNTYGHPKAEIVARYESLGIKLYDSIRDGAITFKLQDSENITKPICYRPLNKRYWQRP
jgi:competence protein ComEC